MRTTPSLSRIIGYSRAFPFSPLSARQNRAVLSSFVSVVFSFLFSKFDALAGCLLRVLGVIHRHMSAFDAGMFAGLTMAAKSQSVFVRQCAACWRFHDTMQHSRLDYFLTCRRVDRAPLFAIWYYLLQPVAFFHTHFSPKTPADFTRRFSPVLMIGFELWS